MASRIIAGKKTVRVAGAKVDVRIAPGSAVTVIHVPPDRGDVQVSVRCDARATVTWITLAKTAFALTIRQEGIVGAKAALTWRTVTGGKGHLSCTLVSRVTGSDARSAIEWIASASHQARQTIAATNVFEASRGSGEILMRSVAADRAHVASKGSIMIGPKGTGTQTHLTQESLMLDATAKVDAVPALEIKTNDVKASHSATVARVTPESLFYFQSRGIPEKSARQMFVDGFLGEMIARLSKKEKGIAERILRTFK